MPRAPTNPTPPRRGGLFRGLRAGARGVWRGLMTEVRGKAPRVIRRMQWWAGWIAVVPVLCWQAYIALAAQLGLPSPSPTLSYIILVVLAAAIIMQFALLLKLHRIRAHAARLNFRICPECGYSLADLADEGTCPECGTAYTPEELEVAWKRR